MKANILGSASVAGTAVIATALVTAKTTKISTRQQQKQQNKIKELKNVPLRHWICDADEKVK